MSYLPRGQRGTVRTLRLMASFCKRDAASVELRGVAHQIISRIAGHDFSSEIRALFDFVRDQITYRKDQVEVERVQDALRTLQFGNGDCDDKVVLLVTLLAVCGHRARFCVSGIAPGRWTHVYCEVMTPAGWLPLDPTPEASQPGWQTQAPAKGIFEIWPATSINIQVVRAAAATQSVRQSREGEILRRQVRQVPASASCLGCECGDYGLGADTYEWKMQASGECSLQKKSCGFWCKVGKGFKTVGKIALSAGAAIAAPFTGGMSLAAQAAIGGGVAAATSVVNQLTAGVPAGSNIQEPGGECAAWLAKKQEDENRKAQEAAAAAAKAQTEMQAKAIADAVTAAENARGASSNSSGGLLSQPLVLAAVVIGGAMLLKR
jgi:hypothetical protein